MKRNRKGFTLAELLIVVAIIGVLVAIAIPIFTAQLERSRESTDLANARSMYAEVMAAAIGEEEAYHQADGTYQGIYQPLKQMQDGWQTKKDNLVIGGVPSSEWIGEPGPNGSCTITYDPDTDTVTVSWDGSGGGSGSGDDPGDNPGGEPTGANTTNLYTAGTSILNNVLNGEGANAQVTITIVPGGTISTDNIDVKHTGKTKEQILEALITALTNQGILKDGRVVRQEGDTAAQYTISIHKNNGHAGGTVQVTAN